MCGILANISFNGCLLDDHRLAQMNKCHHARGPDAAHHILLQQGRIGLAHSRLSIIDLSNQADQPMSTPDGLHWIVFNGEIYNFQDLKKRMEGLGEAFRTRSDTEVLLKALRLWGKDALELIEGIFAFVYVDLKSGYLLSARDRIGVKPLCYFSSPDRICFSSTILPLKQLPEFRDDIDPKARFEMLTAKYIVSPRTIFKQVRKLDPGTWMRVEFSGCMTRGKFWSPEQYFTPFADHQPAGESVRNRSSDSWWLAQLKTAAYKAIKRQLVADVPVGAFLSGGTDSSLVTCLARETGIPIKTFTVGFLVDQYDESKAARWIAKKLGTEHHEIKVTPKQVISTSKIISTIFDEPFGDASAIPTYLISRFAAEYVKVVLSGDGGDEQFFGYNRFQHLGRLYPLLRHRPHWIQRLIKTLSQKASDNPVMRNLSILLAFPDEASLYTNFVLNRYAHFAEKAGGGFADELWLSGLAEKNISGYRIAQKDTKPFIAGMMVADLLNYLPDDCLTKVDRTSMACSLEVRVPLLDENILRTSLAMPVHLKWRQGQGKYILKLLLSQYLPQEIVQRPKMGFGVPLGKWLFNEMKDFTLETLSKPNLLKADLDPEGVQKIVVQHRKGYYDHQYTLWPICCYVTWHLNSLSSPDEKP